MTKPASRATHNAPSGPIAMPWGSLPAGRSMVATSPSALTCAIWSAPQRLTHTPPDGIGDHGLRLARQVEFLHRLVHRDAPDLVDQARREPDRIVVCARDADRTCAGRGELAECDRPAVEPADGVGLVQREPQRVVRSGGDHRRPAARRGDLGDLAVDGDPADDTAARRGEPQRTVGAGRDAERCAAVGQLERRKLTCGGYPSDPIVACAGEPQRAVGPGGDGRRLAVLGQRVDLEFPVGGHPRDRAAMHQRRPHGTIGTRGKRMGSAVDGNFEDALHAS